MSKIEDYTNRAVTIANNNRHGYSQQNRWGPDYDCSSMVITCLQAAGIPARDLGATFTGNMREVLLSCGFRNVTASCNLVNGAGMQRGDILLNDERHTAIYIGNGQIVHARSSEGNSIPGDQSGNEIRVQGYYNCPWDIVLRYQGGEPAEDKPQPEDHVADDGNMHAAPVNTYVLKLPVLRQGSIGAGVIAVQFQLLGQGYSVGPDGADGELGGNTAEAIKEFQLNVGLSPDGVVGPQTGAQLFGGEVMQDAREAAPAAPPDPEEAASDPTLWEKIKQKLRRETS